MHARLESTRRQRNQEAGEAVRGAVAFLSRRLAIHSHSRLHRSRRLKLLSEFSWPVLTPRMLTAQLAPAGMRRVPDAALCTLALSLYCGAFPSKAIGALLSTCRRIKQPRPRDAAVAFCTKGCLRSLSALIPRAAACLKTSNSRCFGVALPRERSAEWFRLSLSLSCSLRPSGRPALPASAISAGADPHSLTRLRSFGGDKSVNISSPPLESRCSSTLLLACAPITELVHPDGQTRQLRTREPVSVPVRPSRRSRFDAQRT